MSRFDQALKPNDHMIYFVDIDGIPDITIIKPSEFAEITQDELLNYHCYNGEEKERLAPNIYGSINFSNQLCYFLQAEILKWLDVPKRAKTLSYVIKVVKKLVRLNNLLSATIIKSGIQNICIYRLAQTWSALSRKDQTTYREMETLLHAEDNFARQRQYMDSVTPPGIPYFGMHLTSLTQILTFVHLLHGLQKKRFLDKVQPILNGILHFQKTDYKLQVCTRVNRFLCRLGYIDGLWKMYDRDNFEDSLRLEPDLKPTSTLPSIDVGPRWSSENGNTQSAGVGGAQIERKASNSTIGSCSSSCSCQACQPRSANDEASSPPGRQAFGRSSPVCTTARFPFDTCQSSSNLNSDNDSLAVVYFPIGPDNAIVDGRLKECKAVLRLLHQGAVYRSTFQGRPPSSLNGRGYVNTADVHVGAVQLGRMKSIRRSLSRASGSWPCLWAYLVSVAFECGDLAVFMVYTKHKSPRATHLSRSDAGLLDVQCIALPASCGRLTQLHVTFEGLTHAKHVLLAILFAVNQWLIAYNLSHMFTPPQQEGQGGPVAASQPSVGTHFPDPHEPKCFVLLSFPDQRLFRVRPVAGVSNHRRVPSGSQKDRAGDDSAVVRQPSLALRTFLGSDREKGFWHSSSRYSLPESGSTAEDLPEAVDGTILCNRWLAALDTLTAGSGRLRA